jgi:hypothetical protein
VLHVLDSFLPEVDIILGQDFLSENQVVLDYCLGRASLCGELNRTTLRAAMLEDGSPPNLNHGPESDMACISAAVAQKLLTQGCVAHLVVLKSDDTNALGDLAERSQCLSKMPDLSHVAPSIVSELTSLLEEYSDIFSSSLPDGVPFNTLETEVIPLEPGSKPPYKHFRRLTPLETAEMQRQVTELLSKGLIEPSASPFGAPVLFVEKKDGTLRMVYDYRDLNKITIKNKWPLPLISDLIDSFQGASYFSTFDLTSGYNQFQILEPDRPKTAFNTPIGHFQWKVLSFGLTNAPAAFQAAMNKLFTPYLRDFVQVYLDDVVALSSSVPEHMVHLRKVLQVYRENKLKVKLPKCTFFETHVKYLGHILSKDGVQVDPDKLKVLQAWTYPTSKVELQRFLGLANYFRRFVPNFSRIANPLYHLTKKNVTFSSAPEYQSSFRQLKEALSSPPTLALPDPTAPYELISDASMTGCGAILVQNGQPVAYFSSKFSPAEVNYTTGEQEMLGIIKALREWRCYLEGCTELTIVSDHSPLAYFPTQSVLSRRQSRWVEFLSRFQYTFKHHPGATNPADPLSRLSLLLALQTSLDTPLTAKIIIAYASDPLFRKPRFTRPFKLENQLWFWQNRVVVPAAMVHTVISAHHDTASSGHFGMKRTADLIARHYWWPTLLSDVNHFVSHCASCQRNKAEHLKPVGLLQPLEIPDSRWHTVTMDFITCLPLTSTGHNAILVFVDKLTKMVHLAPTNLNCTAADAAHLMLQHVVRLHGVPEHVISDRDPRFTSHFWKEFCTHLGTVIAMSTAYHPQTDGQTERANRVIEEVLRHFISSDMKSWEEFLPMVEFAMNNAKNASTGETPFYLNYGKHPRPPTAPPSSSDLPVLDNILRTLDTALIRVKRLLQAAQARQKAYADQHRRPHNFQPGDQVLLSSRNIQLQHPSKLNPKFLGPFPILKLVGLNAAQLQLPEDWHIHPVFHVSLLRPFKHDASQPVSQSPLPKVIDGTPYYTVESILSHRIRTHHRKKVHEYLIKWDGYSDVHNSWEPACNLTPDLLRDFHARR